MKRIFSAVILLMFVATACREEDNVTPKDVVSIGGDDYQTAIIGDLVWTTSNYRGAGGVGFNASSKDAVYGKYYTKAELNAISIPEGWRIPTSDDFKKLAGHYGVDVPSKLGFTEAIMNLTSTTHWKNSNGTNASGFNAYPAGYIYGDGIPLDGDLAEFWSTEGYSFSIQEAGAELKALRIALYDSNNSPDYRFNVRFVKNVQ